MDASCSKCGSTEVLTDIPVVSGGEPVCVFAYKTPGALFFKGPVAHRFFARVCGSCGFAEFYLEDPKGFVAIAKWAAEGS